MKKNVIFCFTLIFLPFKFSLLRPLLPHAHHFLPLIKWQPISLKQVCNSLLSAVNNLYFINYIVSQLKCTNMHKNIHCHCFKATLTYKMVAKKALFSLLLYTFMTCLCFYTFFTLFTLLIYTLVTRLLFFILLSL